MVKPSAEMNVDPKIPVKVDRNLAATFAESAFPICVVASETFVLFCKCI